MNGGATTGPGVNGGATTGPGVFELAKGGAAHPSTNCALTLATRPAPARTANAVARVLSS